MSRDVNSWSPEEVRDLLGISEGNQRVLLHRVRATVRGVRKEYMGPATMSGRSESMEQSSLRDR